VREAVVTADHARLRPLWSAPARVARACAVAAARL